MDGSSQQVCVWCVCVHACVHACVHVHMCLCVCVLYSNPPLLTAVKRTGRKLPSALIMEVRNCASLLSTYCYIIFITNVLEVEICHILYAVEG